MAYVKFLIPDVAGRFKEHNASTDQVQINSIAFLEATNAPFTVTSNARVDNLNVQYLNGKESTDFLLLDGSQAMSGNLDLANHKIVNVADPTDDLDVANKHFVLSVAQGMDWKDSVKVATTSDIGGTYSATGGNSGSGAFSGAALVIDGVTLQVGDRVLVKDQSDAKQNGIYIVTAVDSGNGTADLERAADMDGNPGAEVSLGNTTYVEEGTNNGSNSYIITGTDADGDGQIDLNSEEIHWTQNSGAGQIVAGNGLSKSGNVLSVNVDNITLEIVSDVLQIKDASITTAKLVDNAVTTDKLAHAAVTADKIASDVAGNGLGQDANGALEVNVDASTIEINSDSLRVKASGITANELADNIDMSANGFNADKVDGKDVDDSQAAADSRLWTSLKTVTELEQRADFLAIKKILDGDSGNTLSDQTYAEKDTYILAYDASADGFSEGDIVEGIGGSWVKIGNVTQFPARYLYITYDPDEGKPALFYFDGSDLKEALRIAGTADNLYADPDDDNTVLFFNGVPDYNTQDIQTTLAERDYTILYSNSVNTFSEGDLIAIDSSSGSAVKGLADDSSSAKQIIGIAKFVKHDTVNNVDIVYVATYGNVAAGTINGTPQNGAAVYADPDNAGELTTVAPTDSGKIVKRIGYIVDATNNKMVLAIGPETVIS